MKTITFNNQAVFCLSALNELINKTYIIYKGKPQAVIEDAFAENISDLNAEKKRFNKIIKSNKYIFTYNVAYENKLLKKVNKNLKKVRKYKLPWFIKPYIDFIEAEFNNLIDTFKNGGLK